MMNIVPDDRNSFGRYEDAGGVGGGGMVVGWVWWSWFEESEKAAD